MFQEHLLVIIVGNNIVSVLSVINHQKVHCNLQYSVYLLNQ